MSLTSYLNSAQSSIRQFIHASATELALAGTSGRNGKAMASFLGIYRVSISQTRRAGRA
ncbi:hypothetical protein [Arthrobacter roseus]|uniref:hypothetical protein n=1 Tax=Arthrobacter roseus TaxID=136274 RepID=UPI0019664B36|nr:hypothetical protein [Arthrobacter roseus]MBM7847595.1 hypothetical protein [Arthrobacter roseus]